MVYFLGFACFPFALGVAMALFGLKLSEVENRLFDNIKKTKSTFPEETQTIESGLALMRDVTQVTQDAVNDYKENPNLFANHNLFARNRQLLLNAYFCLLCSSYGTQFVILRVILENNFLMRLFNKKPQLAFEWLSKEMQGRFPKEIQLKYGKSGISDRRIEVNLEKRIFKEIAKKTARSEISTFYKQLSNYIHPNFLGWQELIGDKEQHLIILNMPQFTPQNTDKAIGIMLYLTQLSIKEFVDIFKDHLLPFAVQLKKWQDNYFRLIVRYKE